MAIDFAIHVGGDEVRQVAERLGIYLLNSINPFRIEGQKTIMVEMMDQRDWRVPDWVVLPGGNLGPVYGTACRPVTGQHRRPVGYRHVRNRTPAGRKRPCGGPQRPLSIAC